MIELSERARAVLAETLDAGRHDVAWDKGRVFSLAYYAGAEVHEIAERAYAMYSSANGLNVDAFPSLRTFQSDVVGRVLSWLGGDSSSAGFMTSGGTESILMAVKAARERGRAERGVEAPNAVLPTSAHAAFEKACHYFGVESRRVPVRSDWRADVDAMRAAVDENTVLLVGSAPQYPQGVIDPIEDIARLALECGVNMHVDACMGGVTLTHMRRLGEQVPAWGFDVDGVTSISVDLHKYGYTAKGASVIAYRDKRQRSYQTFVTDNWLGGVYGSSGVLGTKSGGPFAAAWAVMRFLGDEGYDRLTLAARSTALRLADAIESTPGLVLRARPDSTLLSFGWEGGDVGVLAARLAERGWYVDQQGPPPSLHCTVMAAHEATIDEFIDDLRTCVAMGADDIASTSSPAAYGTVE